ncbi:uncharacterized protein DDB_G0284459 [Impatiens glandulifera]|uniref:uncharacterized protein DDB_G0284459 n=1 Tax=Impatiens glandulifera TaxID=253017 RepID=UPI001FB167DC|nr:uncharacterized protein DDB_G0284459 [Impatiens glandulifera]
MDHHSLFPSNEELPNPFPDSILDPLCKLKTSDFVVNPLPMSEDSVHIRRRRMRDRVEAPPTPGRPIFGFSSSRKGFPSKWDDAEKWLNNNGGHESPAHLHLALLNPLQEEHNNNNNNNNKQDDNISEKSRLVTDKFTCELEEVETETSSDGFFFGNIIESPMKDASTEVINLNNKHKHRDIGTEMTPLGSSTTSRCHTPIKTPSSPARHNTPANRSGLLTTSQHTIDISQLHDCHLAKLQFDSVVSTWNSREEEEEEISKSLRHFEFRKSVSETTRPNFSSTPSPWEEDEKNKSCLRYQREEAKIQAWVNLQNAKAEARSRKLEVKIQKMRSEMEEKLMKRMAIVHRKAEEWRSSAMVQHSEQIQKLNKKKMVDDHGSIKNYHHHHNHAGSCACCFPCTTSNTSSIYHH